MLAPSSISKKLYNKSYFEAGRYPKNRSLPSVNEDFEGEPDAKRALLYGFFLELNHMIYNTQRVVAIKILNNTAKSSVASGNLLIAITTLGNGPNS